MLILNNRWIVVTGSLWFFTALQLKLDRVGPIDNRPSTDTPHPFVLKKKKKIIQKTRET